MNAKVASKRSKRDGRVPILWTKSEPVTKDREKAVIDISGVLATTWQENRTGLGKPSPTSKEGKPMREVPSYKETKSKGVGRCRLRHAVSYMKYNVGTAMAEETAVPERAYENRKEGRVSTEGQATEGTKESALRKLSSTEWLREFQRKLHEKAKAEPKFRFHSPYDKTYRTEVIEEAYRRAKANGGASGIDGETFEDVEKRGVAEYLRELREQMKGRSYKPQPVRRVYIPKANGKKRPLGIPTIRDRIVQTAFLLILEPIFEADFAETSYGFRPKRSAHDAVREIYKYLRGWVGYYRVGHASETFRQLAQFVNKRVRHVIWRRKGRRGYGWEKVSSDYIYGTLGLYYDYRVAPL